MAEPADGQQPAKVTDIEVREAAPGAVIELTADQPLVWTSYRDADGNVVVELPNTVGAGPRGDRLGRHAWSRTWRSRRIVGATGR